MKTLLAFLRRTGRNTRRHINRLTTMLKHSGTLKVGVSVSIPPVIKISVDYAARFGAKQSENDI
ncbi:hypothetical protein [Chelativorans sp. AA-79]|uniref:hypothetical protein n=1 Tax=Chelativorans sp. AA-79 TaxID=3028735 RepID=UPI0023F9AB04|nr:hypothetical protein [Chelativorans sp. AA-79]WEX12438.1 hypothetical protein PVE73_27515 [Chelativorans sp. AA-79]